MTAVDGAGAPPTERTEIHRRRATAKQYRGVVAIQFDPREWGTVAEWAAGVGAIAAFLVTLQLLRLEVSARREAVEDRITEQARLVSAWCKQRLDTGGIFVVRNRSEEPIYRFRLWVAEACDLSEPPDFTLELVPPDTRGEESLQAPDAAATFSAWSHLPASIAFVDSRGIEWMRSSKGTLSKVASRSDKSVD